MTWEEGQFSALEIHKSKQLYFIKWIDQDYFMKSVAFENDLENGQNFNKQIGKRLLAAEENDKGRGRNHGLCIQECV